MRWLFGLVVLLSLVACGAGREHPGTGHAADTGDGGDDGDAAPATPIADFVAQVAAAECTRIATCCGPADAGGFQSKCLSVIGGSVGPFGNLVTAAEAEGIGASLVLDATGAATCLADIAALPCTNVPSADWVGVNRDCAAAVQGTLAAGAPCGDQFECAGAAWCDRGSSPVVCKPLGGACGNDKISWACQSHGFGTEESYCDTAGTQTCAPTLSIGTADPYPLACQSGMAQGGVCVAEHTFWTAAVCSFFGS